MSDPAVLDSASSADELRQLFKHVKELRDGIIEPADLVDRLRELCPSLDSRRHLISAVPLHKLSFSLKAGIQRAEAIRLLSDWCESPRRGEDSADGATEIHGFLSVLLITLITIEEGPSSSSGFINDPPDGESRGAAGNHGMSRHNCERTCRALTRIPSVRSVLLALYAPDESSSVQVSAGNHEKKESCETWKRLGASSLEFHCHGSTSFILWGLPELPPRKKFAWKCVLLPYSNVPVIASKTESYTSEHDSKVDKDRSVPHMVEVWASTTRWILMDFADGVTLSEEIEELKQSYRGLAGGVAFRKFR